ncbi:TIGR00725 family protein [Microbispora sp. NPDC049125]|uniref:TIGR00725 family protein n=1 Tax=Microbispora sp. NPDC049125 TaxID=3154929 RepID=UPI003466AE2E
MAQVAVCGPGECTPEEAGAAEAVGRLLAEAGAVVLCGGYGGVMGAAAAGAREAGGIVVGLLPGRDRAGASPDLTVALPTGLGEARNALIVRAADAVIVVGGSWGTLSELALARRTGTPVITLGGWRVVDAAGRPVPGPVPAGGPADAVRLALTAEAGAEAG